MIYGYISKELLAPKAAENIIKCIEDSIFRLEALPYRCSERKVGRYANKGYRQLFVRNFTVVYRIDEDKKYVIIITVKYTPSNF